MESDAQTFYFDFLYIISRGGLLGEVNCAEQKSVHTEGRHYGAPRTTASIPVFAFVMIDGRFHRDAGYTKENKMGIYL